MIRCANMPLITLTGVLPPLICCSRHLSCKLRTFVFVRRRLLAVLLCPFFFWSTSMNRRFSLSSDSTSSSSMTDFFLVAGSLSPGYFLLMLVVSSLEDWFTPEKGYLVDEDENDSIDRFSIGPMVDLLSKCPSVFSLRWMFDESRSIKWSLISLI